MRQCWTLTYHFEPSTSLDSTEIVFQGNSVKAGILLRNLSDLQDLNVVLLYDGNSRGRRDDDSVFIPLQPGRWMTDDGTLETYRFTFFDDSIVRYGVKFRWTDLWSLYRRTTASSCKLGRPEFAAV